MKILKQLTLFTLLCTFTLAGCNNSEAINNTSESQSTVSEETQPLTTEATTEAPTDNVTKPQENEESAKMPVNSMLNELIEKEELMANGDFRYTTGQGQFSMGFSIKDMYYEEELEYVDSNVKTLLKFLAGYEWTAVEVGHITSDCLIISYQEDENDLSNKNFSVTRNGEIFDHSTTTLYRAENMDAEAMQGKFENCYWSNYQTSIAYSLCAGRLECDTTLEAEVRIYYNPLDETGENQPVNCSGMMYIKEQVPFEGSKDCYCDYYYTLKGIDSDYSGEFYKQGRYWASVEKNGSIAKGYYSGDRDFEGYRLFTRDNYIASGGYDNYDVLNIDYDNLFNDAFSTFTGMNNGYMNVLDFNMVIGGSGPNGCTIEYTLPDENGEYTRDYSEVLEFAVYSGGTMCYYKRARKNIATGEAETYLEFELCNGEYSGTVAPGLKYDEPDFKFPEMSAELKQEFELIKETE